MVENLPCQSHQGAESHYSETERIDPACHSDRHKMSKSTPSTEDQTPRASAQCLPPPCLPPLDFWPPCSAWPQTSCRAVIFHSRCLFWVTSRALHITQCVNKPPFELRERDRACSGVSDSPWPSRPFFRARAASFSACASPSLGHPAV